MPLNYLLQEYKGRNAVTFPDPDIDPKEKNEYQYILSSLKGMYSAHAREKTALTPTRQDKFHLNRLYGKGDQPKDYYEQVLINYDDKNASGIKGGSELAKQRRKSWQNLDFDHKVSYAPKVEDHFYGVFLDVEQDIIGYPIDKDSGAKMRSKKLRMLTELKLYEELQEVRKVTRQKEPEWDFFPMDKAELDMFEASEGFKLNHTKAMEKASKHIFSISGWDRLKKPYVSDIINTGWVIGKVSEDKTTEETTIDYIDPEYAILQHSNYWDHRDIEYAGEIKPWTVSDISKYVDNDKLLKSLEKYAGIMGNPGNEWFRNQNNLKIEDCGYFKVPVLHGYYLDYEDNYKKEYSNPYKKKRLIDVPYDYRPKNNNDKVRVTRNWFVYQGCWLIGSEILFNYGKMNYQHKDGRDVKIPIGAFKLTDICITERLIPLYDQLEIGWLKFQNAQAKAGASGNAVNMRLLSNVTMGGEPINPIEALKFMREVGDLPYSDTDMDQAMGYTGGEVKPVHPIEGGMKTDLQEGITKFEWTVRMIEHITGMSPAAMGVQPEKDQKVGNTKMAVEGTQNIIQPNFATIMNLKGKLAKEAMFDLQLKLKYDKGLREYYAGIIGEKDVQAIVQAGKRGARFGIHFKPRPTNQQRMELYQMIEKAIAANALAADEAFMIKEGLLTGANLKDLGLKLTYKIRKREKQMTQKEFAARKQQHEQTMQHNKQQFEQDKYLKNLEGQYKLKEEMLQQKGETQREQNKQINELKELVMRLRQDMEEMYSKERQKLAEIEKSNA